MFFRFVCALVLVVGISLSGVALEKRNLQLRREVSRQYYRTEVLLEEHAKLRLKTQELGAPVRTMDALEKTETKLSKPQAPTTKKPRKRPLLRWQWSTPFHDSN